MGSQLENVSIAATIRDTNGQDAKAVFGVPAPALTGFTAVDGTGVLAGSSMGKVEWTIIPTRDAAPTTATAYFISGQISYVKDGTHLTIPLYPASITVLPEPSLKVKYFVERDVYSDDPFTPEVEPAVPFALGMIVSNQGNGSAKNFTVTSSQPSIIDNEKGLLVAFQLIGTQVGTQQVTPSLTVNLGDIAPGKSTLALWRMTSTIQGQFIDYKASFKHVDDLSNERLSLIDSVEIHETNHVVRIDAPGDDGLPDFLTNDQADDAHLPDTLYSSDGSMLPVALGANTLVDAPASSNHLEVRLTSQMPTGWSYLQLPDPGAGLTLTRVRRSDGKVIQLGPNVWQTDRTLHDPATGAKREQLLHLLDYNSTGSFMLVYAASGAPPLPIDLGDGASVVSGNPFVRNGRFTTTTPNPNWSGSVNYGDGTGLHPLAIGADGAYQLNHTYQQNGTYTVTVSANDGELTGTATLTATVGAASLFVPQISSAASAAAEFGLPFSYRIVATNAPTSYSASGLPPGLTVNSANGLISGAPTQPGSYRVNLSAINGFGTGYANLALTVEAPPVLFPVINSASTASVVLNQSFTYQITATNTPSSFGASGLPAGLSINTNSGLIFGAVAQSGVFNVGLTATNTDGSGSGSLTLTVSPAPPVTPIINSILTASAQRGAPFSYQIAAGNLPNAYNASGLPPGLDLNTASGLISGTPTTAGAFDVILSASNTAGTGRATLLLTVTEASAKFPTITSAVTASTLLGQAYSYQITATNNPTVYGAVGLPDGLTIDTTTGVISGMPTTIGIFNVSLSASNTKGVGTAALSLTVSPKPVAVPFITSVLAVNSQGSAEFSYQITASNTPVSFNADGLPDGLSVNTASGLISGTLTAPGVYSIAITATNIVGTGTANLVLTVAAAPLPVVSVMAGIPEVVVGTGAFGEFTLILSKAMPDDLSVTYIVKGSAVNGEDYALLKGVKKIKAGKTKVQIKVTPLGNLGGASKKIVKFILESGPGYTVAPPPPKPVKVKILAGQ